ncbi:oligoribonuclease [Paenibacillus cymbidii]|uniref:oligoribonuclease n=1 Tax=Paenibacillus cymbidii TaxID=1639034 RepID=UPI0010801C20|nr:oligoribonuclease [Paenibacillus cymbidii]
MARAKQTKPANPERSEPEAAAPAPAEAPVYSRQELQANAEALFGCKPEAVAGALLGHAGDYLTIDEAAAIVRTFLKRKVTA